MINHLGLLGASLTMLMYISPLAELVSLDVNLTRFLQSVEAMINHLGLLGASLTMLMYISPLAELVSLDVNLTRFLYKVTRP